MDPQPTERAKKKLMIVDDDAEMRQLLADYFRRVGFDVAEKGAVRRHYRRSPTITFDCLFLTSPCRDVRHRSIEKMRERGHR